MARFKNGKAGASVPPVRKFTPLELDGETFQLCYDFQSINLAERLFKVNIFDALSKTHTKDEQTGADVFTLPPFGVMAAMLFVSLRISHPEITAEDATDMLDPTNYSKIYMALLDVWYKFKRDPAIPAGESAGAPGDQSAATISPQNNGGNVVGPTQSESSG